MTSKSIVGDLINFRGLVYSPLNENGVIFLFGKVAEDLNMYIEEIKPGFPDCIARRYNGKGWEQLRVEFEYKSSNFKTHNHDAKKCDMIICWEHDWKECPLEVIELKDRIKELENREIIKPTKSIQASDNELKNWFKRHNVSKKTQKLFGQLVESAKKIDDSAFYKVANKNITFYSPERVFLYLKPRKTMLRFTLFTNGQKLPKVKQYEFENGGEKWGGLSIKTEDDLKKALPTLKKSYRRIRKAIKNNEPTGWYAQVESGDDE